MYIYIFGFVFFFNHFYKAFENIYINNFDPPWNMNLDILWYQRVLDNSFSFLHRI